MKLEKNVKIVIGVIVGFLIVGIASFAIYKGFFGIKGKNPTSEEPMTDGTIEQPVEPEEAISMYEEMADTCSGAHVWDLKEGDVIHIDDIQTMNTCKTDNYYSKMIGYTYDLEENLIIHENILKKVDNKLYKMDDTFVADYTEETLNDSLDFGTTYEYKYEKLGEGNYKLSEVKLMALPTIE